MVEPKSRQGRTPNSGRERGYNDFFGPLSPTAAVATRGALGFTLEKHRAPLSPEGESRCMRLYKSS